MQQLVDTASGAAGARPLAQLTAMCGGFVLLCAGLYLVYDLALPRFLSRAMRQYKEFAFRRLMEKSAASFRGESAAGYLSALTNDAATVETDYLSQQLALMTKAVTFAAALVIMLCYSPLLTLAAIAVTALPFAASMLTGGLLQTAERRVSEQNQVFTASISDCLGGFSVVKTFRAEREILRLFAGSNRALEQENRMRLSAQAAAARVRCSISLPHRAAAIRAASGWMARSFGRLRRRRCMRCCR